MSTQALRTVIARGQEQGSLTPEEISEMLQHVEIGVDDLDGLFGELDETGVQVVLDEEEDRRGLLRERRSS